MKLFKSSFAIVITAAFTAWVPQQAFAQSADLAPQLQQAAAQHNLPQQLGILELQMRSMVPESNEFGQTSGIYWQTVAQSGDFVRAYDFFTSLEAAQKTPQPNVLAAHASASGAYLGWLVQNKLMEAIGHARIREIDTTARAEFDQALKLDPENFAALYGYANYESYAPNGSSHAKQLLARLDQLRATHPMYPWNIVDSLKARLQS